MLCERYLFPRRQGGVLQLVSRQSVETFHQANPRGQEVLQLLGLRDLAVPAPAGPVAAVHHHRPLPQAGQRQAGPGEDGHRQDDQPLLHDGLQTDLERGGARGPGAPDHLRPHTEQFRAESSPEVASADHSHPGPGQADGHLLCCLLLHLLPH